MTQESPFSSTVCDPRPLCSSPLTYPPDFLLSVIVPVYNEGQTLSSILELIRKSPVPKEIVLVDDGSTDGTRELLRQWEQEQSTGAHSDLRIIYHARNGGKGAAVRTGLASALGDVVLIQDADLEYSPNDYPELLRPILEGRADVVYGSRYLSGGPHRVRQFWHTLANRVLTLWSNVWTDLWLTDMETCYKVLTREVVQALVPVLRENSFSIEPEITAKIARRHFRIWEIPIQYDPRTWSQGKKIGVRHGFHALWAVLRYGIHE